MTVKNPTPTASEIVKLMDDIDKLGVSIHDIRFEHVCNTSPSIYGDKGTDKRRGFSTYFSQLKPLQKAQFFRRLTKKGVKQDTIDRVWKRSEKASNMKGAFNEEEEEENVTDITQRFTGLKVSEAKASMKSPPRPIRSEPVMKDLTLIKFTTPKKIISWNEPGFFMSRKIDLEAPFEILPEWCISSYDEIREGYTKYKALSLIKEVGADTHAFKVKVLDDPQYISIECPLILKTLEKRLEDGHQGLIYGIRANNAVMKKCAENILERFEGKTIKYLLQAPDGFTFDTTKEIRITHWNYVKTPVDDGTLSTMFAEWLIVLCPHGASSGIKLDIRGFFNKEMI